MAAAVIPVPYDRVMETSTTTGTGTFTLAGAITGYQSFAIVGNGNTCYYCIMAVDGAGVPTGDWEVGIGTYTASGTTLARTTVKTSSNSNAAVNFSAGTKRVFLTVPADWANNVPGLHLVEEHTASSSSSLDFTKITADYDEYIFEFLDLVQLNGNGRVPELLFSTDGGSTYATTNYGENVVRFIGSSASGPVTPGVGGISAGQFRLTLPGDGAGWGGTSANTDGFFGYCHLFNVNSSFYKTAISHVVSYSGSTPQRIYMHLQGACCFANTSPINAVRFKEFSSITIVSGSIRMYGVAK